MGIAARLLSHGRHSHAGHTHDGEPSSGVTHTPRRYEMVSRLGFLGRRRAAYLRIARASGAAAGDRVLDLGCGTGALTQALARVVGPSGQAVGVDPGAEMVAYAAARGPANARYLEMGAEELSFADEEFDAVCSALAVHHMSADEQPRAMAEAGRVLRPGGRLTVVEFAPPRSAALRRITGALTAPAMAHDQLDTVEQLVRGGGLDQVERARVGTFLVAVTGVKGT